MTATGATELVELMTAARQDTLSLFDLADEAVLHKSPGFGFRPIIWHLAHIGVFEAYWLLQKLNGDPPPDERYEVIFDPIRTPRESSTNLPSRREMEGFLSRVRERVFEVLDKCNFASDDPLVRDGYLFRLVLEHEYQHQETLLYLMQMLPPESKIRPAGLRSDPAGLSVPSGSGKMVMIPGGTFVQGATGGGFAYDNESPAELVELPAFRIDRNLTTNAEYQEFIDAGGYQRAEYWSEAGWALREKENVTEPLYYIQRTSGYGIRLMFDDDISLPDHPISGISWYEAEAYARFRGKRLPTESEWEKAASWDPKTNEKRRFAWGNAEPTASRCNFNNGVWGTSPVGTHTVGESADGIQDMTGNVWEWTSTEFAGHPGFHPFPYPEYSQEWFDGDHRVLKGGSWATRAPILRTSFRNFFRRNFRIGFAGIRLAADE
ncbi:MAG: SUMF1/EgtB/PvdO family nonheme iron enzyme [Pyrinomonadaceae bacterium]